MMLAHQTASGAAAYIAPAQLQHAVADRLIAVREACWRYFSTASLKESVLFTLVSGVMPVSSPTSTDLDQAKASDFWLNDLQYVEWPLTRALASHLFLTLRIEAITKPSLES
jgi:hypothetical protein